LSRPTRAFAFEPQRRGNNLENVNQHHGVIVNYNTKSIASIFFFYFMKLKETGYSPLKQ
jgi:hypothetical protein